METEIVKTDDLTAEQVEFINKFILIEFDVYLIQPLRFSDTSRFVLVKDEEQVVAFCRIFDTKMEFMQKEYSILGFSMVYSIIKSKGFGKRLMKEIQKLSDSENKILIGNCESKNTIFYEKSGLKVLENTIKRFVYINQRNIAEINNNSSIVLIHDPTNKFLQELQDSPNENIFIFEHWW
ncbi:MAG: GNAT family N-acetyltransferase [Candidatus Dojkabacteria bacterium]